MRKKLIGKVLSVVLSAAMVMTSVVPSYAAETVPGLDEESVIESSVDEETYETDEAEDIEETAAASETGEETQYTEETEDPAEEETSEASEDEEYESEDAAEDEELPAEDEELPETEEEEVEDVEEEESELRDLPDRIILQFANTESEDEDEQAVCTIDGRPVTTYESIDKGERYKASWTTPNRLWSEFLYWYYKKDGNICIAELDDEGYFIITEDMLADDDEEPNGVTFYPAYDQKYTSISVNYYIPAVNDDGTYGESTSNFRAGSENADEKGIFRLSDGEDPSLSGLIFENWYAFPESPEDYYKAESEDNYDKRYAEGGFIWDDEIKVDESGNASLDLYAHWTIDDGGYTVIFDAGEGHYDDWYDGDVYTDMSIGDSLYFPTPYDAERSGYILTGWLNNTNKELYPYGDDVYSVDDPKLSLDMCEGKTATFCAQWEKITEYELVLYGERTGITVTPGGTYSELPEADVLYGRHFEGWIVDSQVIIPGRTVVTAPSSNFIMDERIEGATSHPFYRYIPIIRLYPRYTMIQYTIVYHLNIGTKDISVSKNYILNNSNVSLDVSKGDLSNNSSFDSKSFVKWLDSDGYEYGKENTVNDIMLNHSSEYERSITVDLYAQWDNADMGYSIAFDANGGSGKMETINAKFNEPVKFKNQFTRTGYEFEGFARKKDGSGIRYVPDPDDPDGNFALYNITMNNHEVVTLYAIWSPELVDVLFYDGDKPIVSYTTSFDKIVDPDGFYSDPVRCAAIRKPGYILKNWNLKDKDGKLTPVDLTKTKYDGSFTTVYAEYVPVTYTITYHSNNGAKDYTATCSYTVEDAQYSAADSEKITYNSIFEGNTAALAILAEHKLSGWALDAGALDPEFTEKELLTGCIDETNTTATVKINAYAQWAPEEPYNVVFVADNASISGAFPVSYIEVGDKEYWGYEARFHKGESIVLSGNEFIKKGFAITGWTYLNGSRTVKLKAACTVQDLPTEEIGGKKYVFVNAVWSAKEIDYKITYNKDGGKLSSGKLQTTYKYNTGYVLPQNMIKAGYEFKGWFADPGFTKEVTKLGINGNPETGNVTLYAKFALIGYTLKLDPNRGGGEKDIITIPVMYGDVVDLSGYQVSYAGRTFGKWLLQGTSKKYNAKAKVKNLRADPGEVTLVAQWNDIKHKITYDYNGAAKIANPTTYTTSAPAMITGPVRDGYVFDGWRIETKTAAGTADIASKGEGKWELTGTDTVTLTAIWAEMYYDVQFYMDDKQTVPTDKETDKTFVDSLKASRLADAALKCEGSEHKGIKGFSKTPGATKADYDLTKDVKISALCANIEAPDTGNAVVKLYAVYDENLKYRHILYDPEHIYPEMSFSKNMFTYVPSNKDQALPKAILPGYTFVKWTTGDEKYDEAYLDSTGTKIVKNTDADLYLIPVFAVKTYDVTIDFNGATDYSTGKSKAKLTYKKVNYEDGTYQVQDKGTAIATAPNNYGYKVGYSFVGYSASKNSKTAEYYPGDELYGLTDKSAITLYAIWKVRYIGISYMDSVEVDGYDSTEFYLDTSSYTSSMEFGKKALTLPKPTQEGYTFLGWRLVSAGRPDVTYDKTKTYVTKVNSKNTASMILKACFAENRYYITVNPNGGYLTEWNSGKYTKKAVKIPYAYRYTSYVGWVRNMSAFAAESYREGYVLKGAYLTSDKAGKKPVTAEYGFTSKNNANVTLYLQWEKAAPSRIERLRATIYDYDEYNWLVVGWDGEEDEMVEVQYSLSPTFRYGTYTVVDDAVPFETRVTGDKYYVRLRRIAYDSAGKTVYGPWSPTVTSTLDMSE